MSTTAIGVMRVALVSAWSMVEECMVSEAGLVTVLEEDGAGIEVGGVRSGDGPPGTG